MCIGTDELRVSINGREELLILSPFAINKVVLGNILILIHPDEEHHLGMINLVQLLRRTIQARSVSHHREHLQQGGQLRTICI